MLPNFSKRLFKTSSRFVAVEKSCLKNHAATEFVNSITVPDQPSWLEINVKASVEKFVSKDAPGYAPNYGWMLKDGKETSPIFYLMFSKEAIFIPPADYKPRLNVKYYPPHLELQISKGDMEAGSWIKMSVFRKTANGESITCGNLKVKLDSTSTSSNKKFALTPGGSAITELVIPDGSDHKDFYYYDEKVGTWKISVWTEQYSPYYGDEKLITVNPGPLDHSPSTLLHLRRPS